MKCEVCSTQLQGPILNLGAHPLCDDHIPIGLDPKQEVYLQEIVLCENCLTAHQLHQVDKEILFKEDYRYRASLTKDVLVGMQNLVDEVIDDMMMKSTSLTVLDVGCNDGSLLGFFKEKVKCTTIGVDPTDAIKESGDKIDFKFQEFFNIDTAHKILREFGSPDVITFTNVFAHIENFNSLLEALMVIDSEETTIVIENHYLGAIIDRKQFDTFYHEHPRTYSAKSFATIANRLNKSINKMTFPSRYGGNIRVVLTSRKKIEKHFELPDESMFLPTFSNLQKEFEYWKRQAKQQLNLLLSEGPVFGKSLPGRAVMLISSLELSSNEMPAVYEQINSPKIGFFVPGTSIKVASDLELIQTNPKRVIVWAWHIIDEVCEYLSNIGYRGEIWIPLPEFKLYRNLK